MRAVLLKVALLSIALHPTVTNAQQTYVESVNLPGASLEQEVTYYPSKGEYERARDGILVRLKAGDKTAFVNDKNGPWMRVETTAKLGFELKGVGVSQGRKNLRQVSAAEEALYQFEHPKN
ncbi:hypothetical protein [uncultured Bradyrhizobium sp.]|uniref:hypothetical protein n=1 Tax=uncultured Bradyrhizobium sp. TaxID=199684 RepID=UPI002632E8E3|nr:hypothetical protein [uncultured Bradyrhizobium sp.]